MLGRMDSKGERLERKEMWGGADEKTVLAGRDSAAERCMTPGPRPDMFAFLASEDAGFATGHVYVMDGAETTGGLCSQWTHE
jgi:hypothetical protein